eukprot:4265025-Alexandrium_andersonii.AAC.1
MPNRMWSAAYSARGQPAPPVATGAAGEGGSRRGGAPRWPAEQPGRRGPRGPGASWLRPPTRQPCRR